MFPTSNLLTFVLAYRSISCSHVFTFANDSYEKEEEKREGGGRGGRRRRVKEEEDEEERGRKEEGERVGRGKEEEKGV